MHSQMPSTHSRQHTAQKLRHMNLGSIIDAQGREVPITEQMILQACRQLERDASPLRRLFG
jgi:hypothetical protein